VAPYLLILFPENQLTTVFT